MRKANHITVNRNHLHGLINIIDASEQDNVYSLLVKFVPEAAPLPDEMEAIKAADEGFARGGFVCHEDIDRN